MGVLGEVRVLVLHIFFDRRLKEVLFSEVSPLIRIVAGMGDFVGAIIASH